MRRLCIGLAVAIMALVLAACLGDDDRQEFHAVLPHSLNLFEGSDVRVLGIRVGAVTHIESHGRHVRATLRVDPDVDIPADVHALLTPESLIGERYVALHPPYEEGPTLEDGAEIPLERTSVPAEVDEVLASLEAFLDGLDPEALGELVATLADTLDSQGDGLNELIIEGGEAVRVLADAGDDLVAALDRVGAVAEALEQRRERIGPLLTDYSTVARTVAEEGDDIVGALAHLRRLTRALRPLLDDHADPLVTDLETFATTLSTLERNLDRVGTTTLGAHRLFDAAGRGFDHERALLRLDNQSEDIDEVIRDRLTQRFIGLCLRLEIDECADPEFWDGHMGDGFCIEGVTPCDDGRDGLAAALQSALDALPEEAAERFAAEQPAGTPPDPPAADPPPALRLPEPPALDDDAEGEATIRDRLARALGGSR